MMLYAPLLLGAWLIEALFGWPKPLFSIIRHPVVWLGWIISAADKQLNRPLWPHWIKYALGGLFSLLLILGTAAFAWAVSDTLPNTWWGWLVECLIASSLVASRSLHTHVAAVAIPLASGNMEAARKAVSMIVGRDPKQLDEAGISRAALESLSENMSDGVIAPVFWGVLFGLPGIAAYKAINTLDSMIGHRSEQHEAFGGFAARLDDIANLIPARLTGLFITLASGRPSSVEVMIRDARKHRSPNAGWPEAAMAGALDVRLSGPRRYQGQTSDDAWLNPGQPDPTAEDLAKGLNIYRKACLLGMVFVALIAGVELI